MKNISFNVSITAKYDEGYNTVQLVTTESKHSVDKLENLSAKLQKAVLNQLNEAKEAISDKLSEIQLETEV